MRKVNMETYLLQPERYILREGNREDAPSCPYGNRYEWIGYDLQTNEYLRFTKSVFKKLIQESTPKKLLMLWKTVSSVISNQSRWKLLWRNTSRSKMAS